MGIPWYGPVVQMANGYIVCSKDVERATGCWCDLDQQHPTRRQWLLQLRERAPTNASTLHPVNAFKMSRPGDLTNHKEATHMRVSASTCMDTTSPTVTSLTTAVSRKKRK